MRPPECLAALVDEGIIEQVVRPLMSGKEAQIYLVVSRGELCVAKVYKAAQDRTFRQRAAYTEGRAVRNTRTQRAMSKHSRYGRVQDEAMWRSAEVDVLYRLRAAGVRVPKPHQFIDGVLVMELITDASGEPAPRLADVKLDRVAASAIFATLLSEVVKMLCAGVVHGDLSDFNVLLGRDGPVLIDFPQAVDPARNQAARQLLLRDVDNLKQFLVRVAPGQRQFPYGPELWDLYARGELTWETQLTGRYQPPQRTADTSAVMREIAVAARDAQHRRDSWGPAPSHRRRRQSTPGPPSPLAAIETRRGSASAGARPAPAPAMAKPTPATASTALANAATVKGASATAAPSTKAGVSPRFGPETRSTPPPARRRRRRRRRAGSSTGR
jgi:RIO kinase 1